MIRKIISLATAIAILDVFLRSLLYPSEPLFLFTSANLLFNIGLVLLAVSLVVLSFKKRFRSWWVYAGCCAAAVALSLFSLTGLLYSDVDYKLYGIIKPFDYLLLLQTGIILGICVLSYKHAKRPAYLRLKTIRRVIIVQPARLAVGGLAWLLLPEIEQPKPSQQPWHA